jgi:hypothetical protein
MILNGTKWNQGEKIAIIFELGLISIVSEFRNIEPTSYDLVENNGLYFLIFSNQKVEISRQIDNMGIESIILKNLWKFPSIELYKNDRL